MLFASIPVWRLVTVATLITGGAGFIGSAFVHSWFLKSNEPAVTGLLTLMKPVVPLGLRKGP